jgi:hypothetical protein
MEMKLSGIQIWMEWSTKTTWIIRNCTFCSETNTDKMLGQLISLNLLQLVHRILLGSYVIRRLPRSLIAGRHEQS